VATGVRFAGFGPTPAWFVDVGGIPSPSDVEGVHLATAEGMASAAVPVPWQREGAEQLLRERWGHPDTPTAADAVGAASHASWRSPGLAARDRVHERYDEPGIASVWQQLVLGAMDACDAGTGALTP